MSRDVERKEFDNKLGAACVQLMLYAFMLEETYHIPVVACTLVFFSATKTMTHVVVRESKAVVESWFQHAADASDRARTSSLTITDDSDTHSTDLPFDLTTMPAYMPKGRPRKT